MEKLIFEYYDTDGISYGTTLHFPFLYNSKKEAEDKILDNIINNQPFFDLDKDDVNYLSYAPERCKVLTLDEWYIQENYAL